MPHLNLKDPEAAEQNVQLPPPMSSAVAAQSACIRPQQPPLCNMLSSVTADQPAILDAIRANPGEERHWLALAAWHWDDGRDDETAIIRVFWPTLRDDMANRRALEDVLERVRRHRRLLGRRAREVEANREWLGGLIDSF